MKTLRIDHTHTELWQHVAGAILLALLAGNWLLARKKRQKLCCGA